MIVSIRRVCRWAKGSHITTMRPVGRFKCQLTCLKIMFYVCVVCCLVGVLGNILGVSQLLLENVDGNSTIATRGDNTGSPKVMKWTGRRDTKTELVGKRKENRITANGTTLLSCPGFEEKQSPAAYYCANGAANRAPISSLRVQSLAELNKGKKSFPMSAPPVCYASNGVPVARPLWANSLLRLLVEEGVYKSVLSLLRQDPWYILIGWVPSKFMAPQKPGRRTNGEPMPSQNRGANATYYLEAYGSVWHAKVEVGTWPFHFQLVHRNAIAVCVRERIHLYKYYCLPDNKMEALPIYVCACRHCVVPADDSHKEIPTASHGRPLLMKEPSLIEMAKTANSKIFLKKGLPQTPSLGEEGTCIDAFEAPWLLNTSVLAAFPYEGKHNDLDGLLEIQSGENGFVTVVIFNSFWRDQLHNFVYSFAKRAKMRNLIVASVDDTALLLCLSFRLPCLNATLFVEPEKGTEKGGDNASSKGGFTRKVTEEFSWVKPRLAIAVLRRGYTFMLADLDITWNRSPMPYLLKNRLDLVHQCDSRGRLSINSGLYMARPNSCNLRYFQDLMSFRTDESADQNAMRLFMNYDHVHGVSQQCLPKWDFNMKCNYKVEGSVRLEDGRQTFRWRPYPLNENPKWVAMHATCLSGAKDKIRYFKAIKAWFLDELDAKTGSTSSPKSFCVVLPSLLNATDAPNRIVHGVFGTTLHSDAYNEMTPDPKYLQQRH
ncbi:hypothetical protein Tc00.1047053508461.84 [Trypanosoma cruzi]|uniref:Nucleotide-diphospho-sugar transferase domain-containing protein n=1 Tax=Trypanosoma cruzi (strain CL Brener) TaxID=353153 RepID=Q4E4V6_TRYCC|nr:hypothetical protein Tc00.1047053508461.84 [Trypanosoma cruzi]EAN99802.1 hypothetical protein Tc00.1047053508461.84 [Trypanosoma cruzi]|eukprot:XP_821653.1 hypothetical protein [Trypanosoma cruzi strain CL Brener]